MNILWELFRHTGKIEYYLKYKEMQRKVNYGRSRGNYH